MEECTLLEVCDMLNSYILTTVQSLILRLGDLWKIYGSKVEIYTRVWSMIG